MKPHTQKRRNRALTLPEVLVVIAMLCILARLVLLFLVDNHQRSPRIGCVSNLKQVDLAFRIWEGDHDNKYPMAVSVTNGGAMETTATGDVVNCFFVMSNELSTPRVLVCPEDWGRTVATSFGDDFNAAHISYFVGVDANESYPQEIMSGDANLLVNGVLVKSGLVQFSTNASVAWGPGRHGDVPIHHFWTLKPRVFVGNIGYADGSVAELSSAGLQASFVQSDVATNRLAIP
jgi:prepilin-type N-terminal cleavage/methylation domain-containing protein